MVKINPGRFVIYLLVALALFGLAYLLSTRKEPFAPAVGNSKDVMSIVKNVFAVETPDPIIVPGNQLPLEKYPPTPKGGGNPYIGYPIVNHLDGSNSPRFTHQEANGHMLGMKS